MTKTNTASRLLLILILLVPLMLAAQKSASKIHQTREKDKEEEEDPFPRFEFGINFGTYLANKYTAAFYSGRDGNVNTVSYVMKNTFWYREIRDALGASASDTVILRELPGNMNYSATLMGGLFLKYNITRLDGIFLQANYSRLNTDGSFTVEVTPQGYTFPDIRVCGIHGREERLNFDLGYHRKFPVYKKKMNLFLQGGVNMNYVQVQKAYINFNDKEFSIINIYGSQYYVPGSNLQEVQNRQGGIGYGLILGGGMGFTFTPQIGLEVGGYMNYVRVNLEDYHDLKPSYAIYLRFMLSNIINGNQD